jgi:hypothetical protein
VPVSRKRYNLNSTLERYNLQKEKQYNTERCIASTALSPSKREYSDKGGRDMCHGSDGVPVYDNKVVETCNKDWKVET